MIDSAPSVADIVADVDKPASYLAAARRLAALPRRDELRPVRVYALSSFTFELMVPYLVVESARRGLAATVEVGGYGQLEQLALDGDSRLYGFGADVVMIATRIEDLAPDLVERFVSVDASAAVDAYVARIVAIARAIRSRSAAQLLVWNQPPLERMAAGLADASLELPQQLVIAELGRRLAAGLRSIPGAVVFDVGRVATELGTRQWFDTKLQLLARMPLGVAAQIAVSKRLSRTLRAMRRPPCKCLVVDLDNTLWGGVLGEDGLGGIALGDDSSGSVFKQFQRVLVGYRDRGILLAIASKNNEADVAELFDKHADMILRRDDFAAMEIHWNDKATSLRAIAARLDIGVDSLAFFDDSAVERAWVRDRLPAVTVIDVPAEPHRYIEAVDESGAFDQLVITTEDRARAQQYQHEVQRRDLELSVASVDEFLRALDIKVSIGRIDAATLPRASQLLAKTNQFNVTTRRYTESELSSLLTADGAIGLWMRVRDRYGDSGLVAVAIALRDGPDYRLDSFVMSCRVLGRKVEHALVAAIVDRAQSRGGMRLVGEFIPTAKNAPASGFFSGAGFAALPDGRWSLVLADAAAMPDMFEVTIDG